MRKTVTLALVLAMLSAPLFSQLFTFGPKAGINYSWYKLSNSNKLYTASGGKVGYHGGLFLRKDIGEYFIQAELNYLANVGGILEWDGDDHDVSVANVNLPVLFGRKFFSGFRIFIGPVPHVYTSSGGIGDFTYDYPFNGSRSSGGDWSIDWQLGASMDISKLIVSLKYEGVLHGGFYYDDINDEITYHQIPMILLSIGWKLN